VRRRGFLGGTVAAAAPIAGCLDTGDAGEEPTGDPTAEPTDTPSSTTDGRTLEDTAFEVTTVECGSDYGHHGVTTSGDTVTVEGVLDGRNTCYTAELVRGEYVGETDTLFVEVEARESEEAAACGQCIVEIHYVATFAFDDGTPERVEVEQRGATTTSGSSSASGSGRATEPDATRTPTSDPDGY
jgi:hypothetical protein